MADLTNWQKVEVGFDILLPALTDYLVRELKKAYGESWLTRARELSNDTMFPLVGDEVSFRRVLDIQRGLKLFEGMWNVLLKKRLQLRSRNLVFESRDFRNRWAHHREDCPAREVNRALDTMARLCEDLDDAKAAAKLYAMMREELYGSVAGSTASSESAPAGVTHAKSRVTGIESMDLPSWRDIMQPHQDVARGNYRNAEFAANLADVLAGRASLEYRDPVEFFARTFVTVGMRQLLVAALKRVTGQGGEPVIQLKTAFGGGKTHSMLALYHLLGGKVRADDLPNAKEALLEAGVTTLPQLPVAVLVGTALDPASTKRPTDLPGITVNTLWGEMAAQLVRATGRLELYDFVKEADKRGTSPGTEKLIQLFDACGACLVLVDELVAYARKIGSKTNLPAGTLGNLLTFVQELSEAAKASKASLVAVSIPESDIEIGGVEGQKALKSIEQHFGRVDAIWQPVQAEEGFEVVRRRLFLDCKDASARERVCKAFSKMYADHASDFPFEAREPDYLRRLEACYPIHPEVFDALYKEWSTLDNFQRTRGVLRLMAEVIHELWMNNDGSALILPGIFPMGTTSVRNELTRYLGDAWNAVFTQDVDGRQSIPYREDCSNSRYGQLMAARRVARAIMLRSAPSSRVQQNRGVSVADILLGVAQPGENIATFIDALHTLRNKLTYLYANALDRYWYDTKPNLRKTMRERAEACKKEEIVAEIKHRLERLRQEGKPKGIKAVYIFPTSSAEIPEEETARLVILPPGSECVSTSNAKRAQDVALQILNTRGDVPRSYRNTLLFLTADAGYFPELQSAVRDYLAWDSIYRDREQLNLDPAQVKEATDNRSREDKTVLARLIESYRWVLAPYVEEGNPKTVLWDVSIVEEGNDSLMRRLGTKFSSEEKIFLSWAPSLLKMELDNRLWKEKDALSIKDLWTMLCSYCYLPRLAIFSVLEQTIREGVAGEVFALASGLDGTTFQGLCLGKPISSIYPTDLLVKPEVALTQLGLVPGPKTGKPTPVDPTPQPMPGPTPTPEPKGPNSFFLSKQLDNTRANRDVSEIISEIVSNLQNEKGCRIEMTLEIHASVPDSFSEGTIRTIRENCRTLKVQISEFGNV